jgi:hypothetical protein
MDLIVGLDPGRLRLFRPAEVLALLAAFEAHTGVDPLADGVKLDEIVRPTQAAAAAVSSGQRPTGDGSKTVMPSASDASGSAPS